jgi:predicted XRE-type DNA-binding protein
MAVKINFPESDILKIISMYQDEGLSKVKIAEQFNVNSSVITRILKSKDIESRGNDFYRTKYSFNEEFFKEIDSEEKAYWLGFIYADGYVTQDRKLGIRISNDDYNHLEKFKNSINSNHKINVYNCSGGYSKSSNKLCQLVLTSEINYLNLVKNGVEPRKSKILKFPDDLKKELIRHFIRGYFDGDGSVYTSNTSNGVSFVGTERFLESLKINLPTNSKVNPYKYKNKDIFELKIGGGNNLKEIYNYFYKDSSVFLDRKFEKFTNIINELKNKKAKTTLTIDDVKKIKIKLRDRIPQARIAEEFGISKSTVNAIAKGRNHADVTI